MVTTGVMSVAGGDCIANQTYIANMKALWVHWPNLARQIDAIPESRLPEVVGTKDGNWTVRVPVYEGEVKSSASPVSLHSAYRPIEEAQRWVEAVQKQGPAEKYVVVVHGFGLGYHIKALWEKVKEIEEALLLVAEPDLPLLGQAFRVGDFSEMLESGRVIIFNELDRAQLVDYLEPRAALLMSGTHLVNHAPSVQVRKHFHSEFGRMFTEFVAYSRTGYMTLMLNNVTTCRNIANNLGRYATTPPLELLQNAYTNVPAILVAAGPSLTRNVHLLKEVKEGKRRAVIIAVQTMLKPLLAMGIEPDFVTSLDYNPISTQFFENLTQAGGVSKVHLVAEAKANWHVLDVFTRANYQAGKAGEKWQEKDEGTMSLAANDFADRLVRDLTVEEGGGSKMGIKAGATVAHLSFYLAEFMGCNPVILIGQDLGFVDGLYYKPGTAIHETWATELGRFNTLETKEWERIARSKAVLRKIPDIHDQPMYTEEQFFVYLQQFERDFAVSRCKVIDATEGGAKKQHVTRMTLRAALDEYCGGEVGEKKKQGEVAAWKQWRCDRTKRLRGVMAALQRRQQECQAMKDNCEATIPLLEEMINKQDDARRMHELFVEVDRRRSKVGQDAVTFEIVCHLNTIGELRRFQHDLAVKTAKKDSKERQKRQLLRDVDYVKNLNIGCDRLLDILKEAQERLRRQLAAMEAGEPWPLEVAGQNKT